MLHNHPVNIFKHVTRVIAEFGNFQRGYTHLVLYMFFFFLADWKPGLYIISLYGNNHLKYSAKYLFLCSTETTTNNVTEFGGKISLSNWWQNTHFWVKYDFNQFQNKLYSRAWLSALPLAVMMIIDEENRYKTLHTESAVVQLMVENNVVLLSGYLTWL